MIAGPWPKRWRDAARRGRLRRVAGAGVAVLLLAAHGAAGTVQGARDELEDWQRDELQALAESVVAAHEDERGLDEAPFSLTADFIKGVDELTYVPFTVAIEPGVLANPSVAMYLAVVPASPGDESAVAGDEPPLAFRPVFEDGHFATFAADSAAGDAEILTIRRAFSAPAGVHDVYVAIRENPGSESAGEDQPVPPILLRKDTLTLPDFWTDQLRISSVILAETVESLEQPLHPEDQVLQPYTLGATRIVPRMNDQFTSAEQLALILLVYNPQLAADGMPDLTIDYIFHQRSSAGESVFNRTAPQQFNAQTLPQGFDLAAGHQIVAGQAVPLSVFPLGQYRVELSVTDNLSGATVRQDVPFRVRP